MKNDIVKKEILGVGVTNGTKEEILEYLIEKITQTDEKFSVMTPNPELIVYSTRHKAFRDILNTARISLVDGVGLMWAGKVLNKPLKERFTGVDFMLEVCKRSVGKPVNIGFLGGGPGIAELTSECLLKKYPKLSISYVSQEWDVSGFRKQEMANTIDILFVAFGFPKQEKWIAENLDKLPFRVGVGVGGAFDYISGNVPRAPQAVRSLGLEWLYRLIRQPWRWRRQLALFEFVGLVLKSRIIPQVS